MSALVYAHYVATVKSEKGSLSLPLLQCRKEDLVLRQEAQLLCDMLGIDSSALCYLGDISPGALSAVGKLSLVLVDHNTPTGESSTIDSICCGETGETLASIVYLQIANLVKVWMTSTVLGGFQWASTSP